MNLDGKTKRRGMTFGKTAKTKKAIVQLTEDSKEIEIFTGIISLNAAWLQLCDRMTDINKKRQGALNERR